MEFDFSTLLSFFLGIGLAAAAGFRVFVPLFALSLAAHFGVDINENWILNENWQWIGSWPAILTLGVATIVEILGYYIPWLDNALDTLAVPLATIAGTMLMGITMVDVDSEVFKWALAIIAGGGTAAAVKGTMSSGRVASTVTTGGTGNFLVSSGETAAASVMSIIAFALPVIAFVLVLLLFYGIHRTWKFFFNRKKKISDENA